MRDLASENILKMEQEAEHRQLQAESLVEAARERRTDEELLREALEALEAFGRWRPDGGEWHIGDCHVALDHERHLPLCDVMRALVVKLQERLLRE